MAKTTQRLDKILSNMGYGTRTEIKRFMKAGFVKVNGTVQKNPAAKADVEKDEIVFDGEVVEYREFIYLLMHKPQGVISSTEDGLHQTVIDLIEPEDRIFDPFPVGRLDIDTEGLLLISNDGKLAHNLLAPKKHVDKTYFARIEGVVTEEDVKKFKDGVTFLDDGYKCLPADLEIIESDEISKINVTIREGKFHQVKRMFEAVGKKVVYLKRISMGSLVLGDDLELGEYRELTDEELDQLKNR